MRNLPCLFTSQLLRSILLSSVMLLGLQSLPAAAQDTPAAIAQTLIGTIERLAQDDGYITISGRNYAYDAEVTRVFLDEEPLDPGFLDADMSVRFSIDAAGMLVRVDVLGPFSMTRLLQQH